MKKIFFAIAALLGLGAVSSCSDMLDTDSSQHLFDPDMNQKTDSMYYAFGVLQALQAVTDQYYLQGEMRGDLVEVLPGVTDKNLQELASFSAGTTNKYDSAYQYYRVINNCNYYIAHRDTSLLTGSTEVVKNEYVAMKAIRAWAYLQLVRNYGEVPFVTEPLTSISQIESSQFPMKDLAGIVNELAPDLAQYSGTPCPNHGDFNVGSTNWGTSITINSQRFYIPVDVILGDLYLENNDYPNAVKYYVNYLAKVGSASSILLNSSGDIINLPKELYDRIPMNISILYNGDYGSLFNLNNNRENITEVQMPVNRQKGITSVLPEIYGYDFYGTTTYNRSTPRFEQVQLKPSAPYLELIDTLTYYYYESGNNISLSSAKICDTRYYDIADEKDFGDDSTQVWISKVANGTVYLYRSATVWLHLAEALNRMGYPDLAFAILKDGLNQSVLDYGSEEFGGYITAKGKELITEVYPLITEATADKFQKETSYGIHQRGCGWTSDYEYKNKNYTPGLSSYQMKPVVGNKLAYISQTYDVAKDPAAYTMNDTINAVEDLLCDEYALELAFEGTRYYDLMRLARHKNAAGTYGGNFGSLWLKKKLAYKNPQKDLSDPSQWYLPFQ